MIYKAISSASVSRKILQSIMLQFVHACCMVRVRVLLFVFFLSCTGA